MIKHLSFRKITVLLFTMSSVGGALLASAPEAVSAAPPSRYAAVYSEKLALQRDLRDRLKEALQPLAEPYEIFISVTVEAEAEIRRTVDRQTTPGMKVDMGSRESLKLPGLPTVKGSKGKGAPKVNITVPSTESISTKEKIQARVNRILVEIRYQPGLPQDRLDQMRRVAIGVAGLDLKAGDVLTLVELTGGAPEEVQMLFTPDLLPVAIISLTVLLSTLMLALAIARRKEHTTEVAGAGGVKGGRGQEGEATTEEEAEASGSVAINGALSGSLDTTHFSFAKDLEPDQQIELLSTLSPEVAAVVIDRIGVSASALRAAFEKASGPSKIALVRALAETKSIETARIESMEDEVRKVVEQIQSRIKIGSAAVATEVLALAPMEDTRAILKALEKDDPKLARQLRSGLVFFEDLPTLPAASIRTAVANLDPALVTLALHGAEAPVRKALLEAVSKRLRSFLEAEEKYLKDVTPKQIEEARLTFEGQLRETAPAVAAATLRPPPTPAKEKA